MNSSVVDSSQITWDAFIPRVFEKAKSLIEVWTPEESSPEEIDRCRRVGQAFVAQLKESYYEGKKTPQKVLLTLISFTAVKLSISEFETSELLDAIRILIAQDGKGDSLKSVQEIIQKEFLLRLESICPFATELTRLLPIKDLLNLINKMHLCILNEEREIEMDEFMESWIQAVVRLPGAMGALKEMNSNDLNELILTFLESDNPFRKGLVQELMQNESFFAYRVEKESWCEIEEDLISAGILQFPAGLRGVLAVVKKRDVPFLETILSHSKKSFRNHPAQYAPFLQAHNLSSLLNSLARGTDGNLIDIQQRLSEHLAWMQKATTANMARSNAVMDLRRLWSDQNIATDPSKRWSDQNSGLPFNESQTYQC